MTEYQFQVATTRTFRIWIAGDIQVAKQIIREFCLIGFCASIQSTDYIYTHGEETGMCVTVINYPRFPSSFKKLQDQTNWLAQRLCEGLHQGSYTVEGPKETIFFSRKGTPS